MTPAALETKLAALRLEAARRCGLDAYPAEAIRDRELQDRQWRPPGWQMPAHGTPGRYGYHNCRCDRCRNAATIRRRKYRQR